MLQLTTVTVFMTSVRPPRGLATIMGKEIDWGDANIDTIGNALERDKHTKHKHK